MACISCGVITSAWLCRISSRWVSAIGGEGYCPVDRDHAHARDAVWSDSCLSPSWPGVYQDEGISLRVQEGAFPSIAGITLDAKFFPEIEAADLGIVHDIVLAPLHQDLAGINDVGPVREV